LRQYVRQANKELVDNKPPKASRELFQYLKQIING
jgi:ribosome-associated protein